MTKDPVTEEFMTILRLVDKGNLGSVLSHNFNNNLWEDKIKYLQWIAYGLNKLHELGYFHKDFHSGNILLIYYYIILVLIFQILDYLDYQINRNQMIKYVE
jgi:tRNA A-37 threonylcarbamoyl transferase component Bud32